MSLVDLKVGSARLATTDQQIAEIERRIERNQVEQIITIVVLKSGIDPLVPIQIMPMGCSPQRTQEILKVSLSSLEHTLGLKKE